MKVPENEGASHSNKHFNSTKHVCLNFYDIVDDCHHYINQNNSKGVESLYGT